MRSELGFVSGFVAGLLTNDGTRCSRTATQMLPENRREHRRSLCPHHLEGASGGFPSPPHDRIDGLSMCFRGERVPPQSACASG